MKQTLLAIFVICLAAGAAVLFHTSQKEDEGKNRGQRPKLVNIVYPEVQRINDAIHAVGTLRSRQAISLTSEIDGRVVELNFASGQTVNKGDVLIRLDDREVRADYAAVQARLKDAQRQLARAEKLKASRSISQSQVDSLRTDLDVARSELASLRVLLDNHQIIAPISGRIGIRDTTVGTYLEKGQEISTLDAMQSMELIFSVPERYLGLVGIGQTVLAKSSAYSDQWFVGELLEKGTRVDNLSRTLPVIALVPNASGELLPGMHMSVEVSLRERSAIMIPEQAVLVQGANQYVFTVEKGLAVRKDVQLGLRNKGFVEVVTGIVEADSVVVTGQTRLSSGNKVKLAKEDEPIPTATQAAEG